jgi:hypothetical protein
MVIFNRIITAILWFLLLVGVCLLAVLPLETLGQIQMTVANSIPLLQRWRAQSPTNFLIAQAAFGVTGVLIFGTLLWVELLAGRRRGVRIRTAAGGSAEVDAGSVGRRLEWHLDQVAEIISVVPTVKARGSAVDIVLEVETAPAVDIPMKTEEVFETTRDIIEQDMGLKLGKLDVRIRYAPFAPDWVA